MEACLASAAVDNSAPAKAISGDLRVQPAVRRDQRCRPPGGWRSGPSVLLMMSATPNLCAAAPIVLIDNDLIYPLAVSLNRILNCPHVVPASTRTARKPDRSRVHFVHHC